MAINAVAAAALYPINEIIFLNNPEVEFGSRIQRPPTYLAALQFSGAEDIIAGHSVERRIS
jgi:hypothetical protein